MALVCVIMWICRNLVCSVGRLIVDMSFPHIRGKVNPEGDVPLSCNSTIDMKAFPAKMSSTKDILQILLRHGPGVAFCKQDWADAVSRLNDS